MAALSLPLPLSLSIRPSYVFKGRYRNFTLRWQDMFHLYVYICIWYIILVTFPNSLNDVRTHKAIYLIGGLGLWRYSWWLINLLRSQYYGHIYYPQLKAKAEQLWQSGWRPSHVHFLMTTFHEHPETTHKCLESIVREVSDCGIKATLWVGSGAKEDEDVITGWLNSFPSNRMNVFFVRQNVSGKRAAIGLTLRALSRHKVQKDDLAILLDGDSILDAGCLRKCVSLLGAFPDVKAITTDEDVICEKPQWMQKWLTFRFTQRRMWMQSHALSHRVLTLTGRFSMFRARNIINLRFIRLIEADHLEHWFWGSFRFLSGDDKSSWYYMLSKGANMLYVPDALVHTIERIEGNPWKRAVDNILRWSGNMLRNGMRAIQLGPRRMPFFIWWSLVDQRLTIWTTLAGFFTAVSIIFFVNINFIFTYILWLMFTRLLMSLALFFYSERIRMSFPLILYCNQLLIAFIKVYLIFRLPQQRWANRQDQSINFNLTHQRVNRIAVLSIQVFYLAILMLAILLVMDIAQWPDIQQIL